MDSKKIDVSIIIINYNTRVLLFNCIKSIMDFSYSDEYEIVVVDNNSNEKSKDYILENFPKVKWIQSETNLGFGKANNLGARNASGEFIAFVNSDVIFHENTIDAVLKYFKKEVNIGVLGCKLLNSDGTHQKSTYPTPGSLLNILNSNHLFVKFFKIKKTNVHAVMGAFMFMRKNDFLKIHGFDPDFFMYAEELDLCRRLEELNTRVVYYDNTSVFHLIGGSSETSTWSRNQNWLSNALLYLKKGGFLNYVLYHALQHINMILNLVVYVKLDISSKKALILDLKGYFSSYFYYFVIPFVYSRKIGKGKRDLRY